MRLEVINKQNGFNIQVQFSERSRNKVNELLCLICYYVQKGIPSPYTKNKAALLALSESFYRMTYKAPSTQLTSSCRSDSESLCLISFIDSSISPKISEGGSSHGDRMHIRWKWRRHYLLGGGIQVHMGVGNNKRGGSTELYVIMKPPTLCASLK